MQIAAISALLCIASSDGYSTDRKLSVLVSSENEDDFVEHLCTILCEFRWHSW
jgi:hypothetical protein